MRTGSSRPGLDDRLPHCRPFVGESRANWLRTYAASTGTDLSASYGYGDSHADMAWLELVGTAHAINPDARRYRHARQANWIVEYWK